MNEKTSVIALAHANDFAEISEIYKACSRDMNHKGLFNWNETYPDVASIQSDIDNSRLWKTGSPIIGVVAIFQKQPYEYEHLKWGLPKSKYAVIRRLAVHPDFQSQGIAKKIMTEIEILLKQTGFQSIRLDVFSLSKQVVAFYRKMGYEERGIFEYKTCSNHFIAMDKAI